MARQGSSLLDSETQRIITMLATTNMSLTEIGRKTGRDRGVIGAVNRRFHIRDYVGRRNAWSLNCDLDDAVMSSFALNIVKAA